MASGVSEVRRARQSQHPIVGRPKAVSLTPRRLNLILEKVRNGVPPQTAAGTLGIPRQTWSKWLTLGRADGAVEPYRSLADRLDAAVDEWHESRVKTIEDAGQKDYRASAWLLERRLRDQYGDPKGDVNVQVTLAAIVQSPDWLDLRDRLLRALSPFPEAMAAVVGELGGMPVIDAPPRQLAA